MTIESQAQDLLFDVSGGVARITINRPEARNACTFEMYEKLAQACEAVGGGRACHRSCFPGSCFKPNSGRGRRVPQILLGLLMKTEIWKAD